MMKNFRKTISSVLALLMIVGALPLFGIAAAATGTPTLTVDSVTADAGTDFVLPIRISDNPGISAFNFSVSYDAAFLTLKSVSKGADFTGSPVYKTAITWVSLSDYTGNGEFLLLNFSLAADAPAGTTLPVSISYTQGSVSNAAEDDVDFAIVPGGVTVSGGSGTIDPGGDPGNDPTGDPTLTVSEVAGKAGETVAVPVIVSNNPGFSSAVLTPVYDASVLTLTEIESEVDGVEGKEIWLGDKITWARTGNLTSNGTFFVMKFKIAEGAAEGVYPVTLSYSAGDVSNWAEEDVEFDVVLGSVSVVGQHIVIGSGEALQGADITIPVSIEYNPGFSAMVVKPIYDNTVMTLKSVTLASGITGQIMSSATGFSWVNSGNYTGNGQFLVMTFALNADAAPGEYAINLDASDVSDFDENDVFFTVIPGTITILSHVHDYEGTVTGPTCTEQGYTTYVCSICGDSYDGDFVDALGHDFGEYLVTTEPTCTEAGVETRTCGRCGETETRPVDALGHDYVGTVTDPTCTDGGYTTYVCSRCNDSYVDDLVDALGHNYDDVVTDPTCTEAGYTTHTCSVCGDTFTDTPVDPLGHDYTGTVTDPTCTEGGYTTYVCSRCGDTYDGDPVDALGHDYVATVTDPTCTEQGYTTYVCSRCGDTYVDDYVDALGHDYVATVTDPTCTEQGYTTYVCSRCGDNYVDDYVDALGHNWPADWTVVKEATEEEDGLEEQYCLRCGERQERAIPSIVHVHDYVPTVTDPTCTEQGYTTYVCRCGDSYVDDYVDALGHDFGEWTVTTESTCTAAGVETRTCGRCGEAETRPVDVLGHTPADPVRENEVEATCTVGAYWEEAVYCSVCGEELSREVKTTDALGHDYEGVVTEPTCTDGGYTTYTCTRCGDSYVADETNALGHDFGEWTVTIEPTCTAAGVETRICGRCGETETQPAAELGHDWDEGVVTTRPTETETGIRFFTCLRCGETKEEVEPVLDYLRGDINGDGVVNTKDLTRLMKYLADDTTPVVTKALDVNGDGVVDSKDLTRLLKYISGATDEIY